MLEWRVALVYCTLVLMVGGVAAWFVYEHPPGRSVRNIIFIAIVIVCVATMGVILAIYEELWR